MNFVGGSQWVRLGVYQGGRSHQGIGGFDSGQQMIERRSERINVGARIRSLILNLLEWRVGKQLLERCHTELETKRAVAIVWIEPVVTGLQDHSGGDEDGLVSGAADLKEYLILILQLNLF